MKENADTAIQNLLRSRLERFNNVADIEFLGVKVYGSVCLRCDFDETKFGPWENSGSMFGNMYFNYDSTKYGVQVRCNFYRRSEDRSDIDFNWNFRPMIWIPKRRDWRTFEPADEFIFQPDDIRNILGNDFEDDLRKLLSKMDMIVNPNLRKNYERISYQDAILE
mgnify:CR=1 FL=1